MKRFVCIHGHFYQPPRENPWLEAVEHQRTALPYHDWNERITAECYGPNTAARIMDREGYITDMVNNYSLMSFDFGPTLLSWLERNAPEVYGNILKADREAQARFSGHGAAMAQCYNHMIMPLANSRDKRTQILWGIGDFEHRFHRRAEGMWLPETAVDLETLEIMSEMGLGFVVLDAHQARRFTGSGIDGWKDVHNGGIDTRVPYYSRLPSGRRMNIFFYNGPVSKAVSFDDLLGDGERFVLGITEEFSKDIPDNVSQLVSIATDGETYGHHKKFGEMGLSYCLRHLESNGHARLTVFGEYLANNPPFMEVEILENTSWSCVHGVERWRSDCGCTTGDHPLWNQGWRGPLRKALDWLRDLLSHLFEEKLQAYVNDPWSLRDDYITLILDRSPENVEGFFRREELGDISGEERVRIMKLLEMERHAMLMYTSCGWFFDEVSRIEPRQILAHASRAIQLAEEVGATDIERTFLDMLKKAPSNKEKYTSAADVYEKRIRPVRKDIRAIGTSFALSTLFMERSGTFAHNCYTVTCHKMERIARENYTLSFGSFKITSTVTLETEYMYFGLVYEREGGDGGGIHGGVRTLGEDMDIASFQAELTSADEREDIPGVKAVLDRHVGNDRHSMDNIMEEGRKNILIEQFGSVSNDIERLSREIFDDNVVNWMTDIDSVSLPLRSSLVKELLFCNELERLITGGGNDIGKALYLMKGIRDTPVLKGNGGRGELWAEWMEKLMARLQDEPRDSDLLREMVPVFRLFQDSRLKADLWKVRNRYFGIGEQMDLLFPENEEAETPGTEERKELFRTLGELIGIRREV